MTDKKNNFAKDINIPSKKQIIIDGVDVSECRNFDIENYKLGVYDCDLNELHGYCICNNDCYFKQLARKTQECESLKEEVQILQDNFDTVTRDCNDLIDELRQECEKKNKEINGLNIVIERLLEVSGYDKNTSTAEDFEDVYADIDYKLGLLDELKQECEKLKEENKNLRCMYESMSDLCEIKDEALIDKQADIDELSHHCFEYSDRIYHYRKVLKEIERYCSIKNDPDIQDVPYRIIAPAILDIINKAKGGEDERK